MPMKLSVVLTVLNEERNTSDFLDTMIVQEQPLEIIVVDAGSRDRTQKIVRRYSEEYPFVKLHV